MAMAQVISGTGGLSQVGIGTTILSGNNTFTVNVSVTAGTLSLQRNRNVANPTASSIGNTQTAGRQVTIASGAILNFASTDTFGNDVYLNYIIPEPRAALLDGLGLLILLRRRR